MLKKQLKPLLIQALDSAFESLNTASPVVASQYKGMYLCFKTKGTIKEICDTISALESTMHGAVTLVQANDIAKGENYDNTPLYFANTLKTLKQALEVTYAALNQNNESAAELHQCNYNLAYESKNCATLCHTIYEFYNMQ